eukprot:170941-Chlamydomonas_euryale.AAC.2
MCAETTATPLTAFRSPVGAKAQLTFRTFGATNLTATNSGEIAKCWPANLNGRLKAHALQLEASLRQAAGPGTPRQRPLHASLKALVPQAESPVR